MSSESDRVLEHELSQLMSNDDWLRPLIVSLVGHADADDVLQQTWLVAVRSGIRAPGWLARVARNFALSRRKSEARRRVHEQHAAQPEALPSTEETVGQLALRRSVVKAVMGLPDPIRGTILHRYFHGLSHAEIAAREAVSEAAVRQRTKRGLDRLRKELGREIGEDWRVNPALLAFAWPARLPSGFQATFTWWMMSNSVRLGVVAVLLLSVTVVLYMVGGEVGESPRPVASGTLGESSSVDRVESQGVPSESVPSRVVLGSQSETPAVVGRVLDSKGAPVRDLALRHVSSASESAAVTDVNGSFSMHLIRDGRFEVDSDFVLLREPTTAGLSDCLLVVARSVGVRGCTTDTTGNALSGVDLHFIVRSWRDFPESLDRTQSSFGRDVVKTDDDGSFSVPRLPAGCLRIDFRRRGFLPVSHVVLREERIEVVMSRPFTGQRLVVGRVLDGARNPRAGAEVGLGLVRTTSDEYGRYRLELSNGGAPVRRIQGKNREESSVSLRSMLFDKVLREKPERAFRSDSVLWAAFPGYQTAVIDGFGERLKALREGHIEEDLVIDQLSLSIEGRILDSDGAPLEGVLVYPWNAGEVSPYGSVEDLGAHIDHETVNIAGFELKVYAQTNAAGKFDLHNLVDGDYRLRVLDLDSYLAFTTESIKAGARGVIIHADSDALIDEVTGRVVSLAGVPLDGIEIEVGMPLRAPKGLSQHWTGKPGAVTDEDGRFRIASFPKSASFILTGDRIVQQTIVFDAKQGTDVELRAEARCHLRVEVYDPDYLDGRFEVRDANGKPLMLTVYSGTTSRGATSEQLIEGRSPVFAVSERARVLILHGHDGAEAELSVRLVPGELTVVRK